MHVCTTRDDSSRHVSAASDSPYEDSSPSLVSLPDVRPTSALATQQTPQSLADAELPSLLTIYKDLHAHPELSTQEEKTLSAIVAKELKAAGCEVTDHVGKYDKPDLTCYGVVGVMKNGTGPTVWSAPILDALPVKEETGLPYASTVTTKDDATARRSRSCTRADTTSICRHLSASRAALAKLKDQWHGTIIFVGQPAEETVGGARAMLNDGLYTRFGETRFRDRISRSTRKLRSAMSE